MNPELEKKKQLAVDLMIETGCDSETALGAAGIEAVATGRSPFHRFHVVRYETGGMSDTIVLLLLTDNELKAHEKVIESHTSHPGMHVAVYEYRYERSPGGLRMNLVLGPLPHQVSRVGRAADTPEEARAGVGPTVTYYAITNENATYHITKEQYHAFIRQMHNEDC